MWRYLKRWGTESGPASWVCGSLAGPHTQKAPVYKINSCKQQLCRGNICIQQNVPIVMDSWVLTNVTTTTIKIQNVSKKKKKKSYRTCPLPQKAPSCTGQSQLAPQPQTTSDQLSITDLFCHFQNSTKMKSYSTHLCFSSLPSVPYSEIHQVVVLLILLVHFLLLWNMDTPQFVSYWWIFGWFPVWGFYEHHCCDDLCSSCVWTYAFLSL